MTWLASCAHSGLRPFGSTSQHSSSWDTQAPRPPGAMSFSDRTDCELRMPRPLSDACPTRSKRRLSVWRGGHVHRCHRSAYGRRSEGRARHAGPGGMLPELNSGLLRAGPQEKTVFGWISRAPEGRLFVLYIRMTLRIVGEALLEPLNRNPKFSGNPCPGNKHTLTPCVE